MNELVESKQAASTRTSRIRQLFVENPITLKELRGRMRGARAFLVLTSYLIIMTAFVLFTYLVVVLNDTASGNSSRTAGQAIFVTLLSVQVFLVIFISPAFTAGAISGEKERQTFELLRTTLLSGRAFVAGKLISALSYVFLLVLAAVPLISIAFMLGGVAGSEVVLSQVLLLVTAVAYAMIGLYYSSAMRSTLSSSIATYITILALTAGIPILFGFGAAILGPLLFDTGPLSRLAEVIGSYSLLVLSWLNLPSTLIVSDLILREENTLWWFWNGGSPGYLVFSPWFGFIAVQLGLTWFYFRRTVRRVERIAEN